jgi:MerR family glutamine synthetase transcriptional repressor
MSDEIRRNMALFPIGIVMKLTDLSARQIRYYEQHELIVPARTEGNQRLFSFNDVERLLEIKGLIEKGVNIAGIKQMMKPVSKESEEATVITPQTEVKRRELSDSQLRKMLKQQLITGNRHGKTSLLQGELSRFFK